MQNNRWIGAAVMLALAVLVGVGMWRTSGQRGPERIAVVRSCEGVMGTTCSMAALVAPGQRARAEKALDKAENALRAAEIQMSTWLDDSELGRLNSAAAGVEVPLSPGSLRVLRLARQAAVRTDGAFDITCRPVIELWRKAPQQGTIPAEDQLAQARADSNWDLIELTDQGALKHKATARVDLGGIAKGYGIDRALEVLRKAELAGGLVDVGGDLACFGHPPLGEDWQVDVKNPFGAGHLVELHSTGGAVCTSGNYARFTEIGGKRYGHIIDPRTGQPTDAAVSVTVVAANAVTADIWATSLSVLGLKGFKRLPHGVEAMIVTGSKDDHKIHCTPGFRKFLKEDRNGNTSPL